MTDGAGLTGNAAAGDSSLDVDIADGAGGDEATAYVKEQLTVQFTELSDEEAENFSEQFVEKMFN